MKKAKEKDLIKKDYLLTLEQISLYCGIPIKRVANWVENKGLKLSKVEDSIRKVSLDELIDFLVRHNMPIPDPIIPLKVRKILFVFAGHLIMDEIVLKFLMKFFERLKREANLIVDYCSYGSLVKMKLLIFRPDLIILDVGSTDESCELCHLVKSSDEFEGIKVAAIVESSKINAGLKNRLCVDALLPRCVDIKSLMENINQIFDKG
ncbi:MAG: hypothetical protein AB1632_06130 [Nitrospirota bacterium]